VAIFINRLGGGIKVDTTSKAFEKLVTKNATKTQKGVPHGPWIFKPCASIFQIEL
jgi:hypothetical protein